MSPAKTELIAELIRRSANDFDFFLEALVVKSGRGPQEFRDVMASFQRKCFTAIKPSLEAIRDGKEPPIKRFWIERTKKASKDTDIAACVLWLLAFPKRPLLLQIGAADRDQAAIARDRLQDYLYYNPWLNDLVKLNKYDADSKNKLVHLDIQAADIAGSHGATPDFLVCNELSHVSKWEFIENLLDNADGVPNSVAILATNAGFKDKPAWRLRQNVMSSQMWSKHVLSSPAPWHSKAFLEDTKQRSTDGRYKRLWEGVWQSASGDSFSEDLIDRLFCLEGPTLEPLPDWIYVAGMDLGITHDHSAVVILGVSTTKQKIRVANFQAFEPNERTGEVNLMQVESTTLGLYRHYRCVDLGYDPHQAKLMAQRLRVQGVNTTQVTFQAKNLDSMATRLKEALETQTLEAYDDNEGRLRRDLGKFSIVERQSGLRLEAISDETGHADVGTALAIALLKAVDLLGSMQFNSRDSMDWSEGIDERDKDEVGSLPDEFRDLFEMDDEFRKASYRNKRSGVGDELF